MTLKEKLRDIDCYIDRIMDNTPLEFREEVKHYIVKKLSIVDPKIMSPKDMSDNGLIALINHRFLHPIGLAMARDPDTNKINGCLIAPDFKWEFREDVLERNLVKYNDFIDNQEKILTGILERK